MNSNLFPTAETLTTAKILIIDDELAHIRVLEWALKQAKFTQFMSLTDSTQAEDAFRKFEPDLVLLDLNMPQLDGFAVLQILRQTLSPEEFLPVLVLTGDNTADSRKRALDAGANDFLPKPLDYTEAMMRIRNLLQTRFLYKQSKELQKQVDALSAAQAK